MKRTALYSAPIAALLLLGGCVERSTPTSPLLEQAVFQALGGLAVGEAITFTGPAANEVLLSPSARGEFVLVPFHASTSAGLLSVEMRGENLAVPSQAMVPQIPRSPGGLMSAGQLPSGAMHEALYARMMEATRSAAVRASRAPDFPGLSLGVRAAELSGSSAQVGQVVPLRTIRSDAVRLCEEFDVRSARVEAISQHAIVVADLANPANGFSRAQYAAMAEEFDRVMQPALSRHFPPPTDIDGNGRVIIFVTRAVNELTRPGTQGFVGGFFFAGDLFPREFCEVSNESEIFYILAADPNAEASHIPHTTGRTFNTALGTIAHEHQHLTNAGRRIYVHELLDVNNPWEAVWLDEGLSHIAEEVVFYAASGLRPKSNITLGVLNEGQPTGAPWTAFIRYGSQNVIRYGLYLENVSRESPTHVDRLETRGATWSFLRYVADHTERSDESLFRALGDTNLRGFANLAARLEGEPLDWFQRWGVSVYTDDLVAATEEGAWLQQPSWNHRSVLPPVFNQEFPLAVRTLAPGQPVNLEIRSTSSAFVRFGASRDASRVVTTSGNAPPPRALRLTVVRLE